MKIKNILCWWFGCQEHPHGRKVWTLLHRAGKFYIDFGVMPLVEKGE